MTKRENKELKNRGALEKAIYELNSKLWPTWYGKIALVIIYIPVFFVSGIITLGQLVTYYLLPHAFAQENWINKVNNPYIICGFLLFLLFLFLCDNFEKTKQVLQICNLLIKYLIDESKTEEDIKKLFKSLLVAIGEMEYKKEGDFRRAIRLFLGICIYLFLGQFTPLPTSKQLEDVFSSLYEFLNSFK